MKIIRFIALILPFVAIGLVVTQLLVSNALASEGRNTQSFDTTIETLRSQNELLRQELATATALSTIETKAKELGFTTMTTSMSLVPADVAYNR